MQRVILIVLPVDRLVTFTVGIFELAAEYTMCSLEDVTAALRKCELTAVINVASEADVIDPRIANTYPAIYKMLCSVSRMQPEYLRRSNDGHLGNKINDAYYAVLYREFAAGLGCGHLATISADLRNMVLLNLTQTYLTRHHELMLFMLGVAYSFGDCPWKAESAYHPTCTTNSDRHELGSGTRHTWINGTWVETYENACVVSFTGCNLVECSISEFKTVHADLYRGILKFDAIMHYGMDD